MPSMCADSGIKTVAGHRKCSEIPWRGETISSLVNMGRHFGNLAKVRHIITFSLSPFEQRAFPNYFSKGIPNVWRRFRSSVFRVAPPMVLMYLTYTWGTNVHQMSKRKNPADYENDE